MNETLCPFCKIQNPENAVYCCKCGKKLSDLRLEKERLDLIRKGKIPLLEKVIETENGRKVLRVICGDITKYPEDIDLLTVSAFKNYYGPVPRTLVGSLHSKRQISVSELAEKPYIDFRDPGNCWISEAIGNGNIRRIGCVELSEQTGTFDSENDLLTILKTYFHILDTASDLGVPLRHVASPMLGTGRQKIDEKLVAIPLVNEIISFLRRNQAVETFTLFHRTYKKAVNLADLINNSYQIRNLEQRDHSPDRMNGKPYVFVSYTSKGDREAAELICRTLAEKQIDYWFALKDIQSGAYAEAIFNAINKCTHFICLISRNSMRSEHVLNEIDLAFHHVKDGMKILPYRLDQDQNLSPSFSYYLSRMQWHNGFPSPKEKRAREFIEKVFG